MQLRALFANLLALIFLQGCTPEITDGTGSSKAASYTPPYFVAQRLVKPGNEGVIIFVHGIFGDAKKTWINDQTGASFPFLVSQDSLFKGFDVYSYGYSTPYLRATLNIDELAENMRLYFDHDNLFRYRKIVFVCHSMGGLVTRAFLTKYRERVAAQTKLIYLYATPSNGSDIAKVAQYLSGNPQLTAMQTSDGNQPVDQWVNSWRDVPQLASIPTYCAYEKRPVAHLVTVVPMASATALGNRPTDPIDADHLHICTPADTRAVPYIAFCNAFAKELRPPALDSSLVAFRQPHTQVDLAQLVLKSRQKIIFADPDTPMQRDGVLLGGAAPTLHLTDVTFETPAGDDKDDDTLVSVLLYNATSPDVKYALYTLDKNEKFADPSVVNKPLRAYNDLPLAEQNKLWFKLTIHPTGNDHWRTRVRFNGQWSNGRAFTWLSPVLDLDQDRPEYSAPVAASW